MKTAFAVVLLLVSMVLAKPHKNLEKRSLYTEKNFGLTGMERISKRSVDMGMDNAEADVYFLRAKRSIQNGDDMERAESGVYFLPSFARRNKRSLDDLDHAESGVYFLPSFARRGKRSVQSVDEDLDNAESGVYFLPSFARRG